MLPAGTQQGPAGLCPSHWPSPLRGRSISKCLPGTGRTGLFALGIESHDCVAVSASQQGKCSHFLSKWGSELSLCHPLPLSPSGYSAFPRVYPLQSVSLLMLLCCFLCFFIGFAKSLASILSAENMPLLPPHPHPALLPKRQCGLSRGSVLEPHVLALALGALC